MSLNARAVALQGVGFAALVVAVQGFAPVQDYVWDTTQGMAGKPNLTWQAKLRADDELATDLIVALVTKGFFNGNY